MSGVVSTKLQKAVKTHPNQSESFAAALRTIALFEGCSNGQLSQGLDLSHSATVRLVSRLVNAGLIKSEQGKDKRSVALHLTEKGQEQAMQVLQQRCVTLAQVVNLLSSEQQAQLDNICETLLTKFAETPFEGGHICRLCDHANCPEESCPVHSA